MLRWTSTIFDSGAVRSIQRLLCRSLQRTLPRFLYALGISSEQLTVSSLRLRSSTISLTSTCTALPLSNGAVMTSIDDLPIPSPSLGHQLSHSDSLDSLSEYGSQRLRLINGGSSREAAESPRRRSSVLSSLSPLTHSTTCSIGLKTGLSSEHLSREQARAKKEMPSPPATTRGSDNASTDSRDRFTPPGVGTEDGHRSSLGHLRSRSSPQRSPTFKRSSLARLSMQREPEDEHEELDAPVASSSRRSSLALDRSPRRLNSPGVVRSESTGSSRQKHRLGTAAQQRERNQRVRSASLRGSDAQRLSARAAHRQHHLDDQCSASFAEQASHPHRPIKRHDTNHVLLFVHPLPRAPRHLPFAQSSASTISHDFARWQRSITQGQRVGIRRFCAGQPTERHLALFGSDRCPCL